MKKSLKNLCVIAVIYCSISANSFAQFIISGQLMQRGEFLHGYGTLADSAVNPAAFIGQRARLNVNYTEDKFKAGVSLQDIRIWGNTPQTKLTDGLLSIHEAWGEYSFTKSLSMKAGRQELDYDDARFLGNLDWALQARAHDIALIKYEAGKNSVHAGAAYNQESQQLFGNFYTMQNQYKTAQFIHYRRNFTENFKVSAMFWNNGLQYHFIDEYAMRHESIVYSQTFGLPKVEYAWNNWLFNGFYYHQTGKDGQNRDLNAFDASAEASYLLRFDDTLQNKLRITAGGEFLSGTSQLQNDQNINYSYNPMFGTNHRFNGYMDYFFVGGRHLNNVGLQDYFIKFKYDFNPKVFVNLNTHYFISAADIKDASGQAETMDPYLGTEVDFTLGLILNQSVSLQAGYSQMFATASMEALRAGNKNELNNWAYVMILFRPNMKNRFTGLKF